MKTILTNLRRKPPNLSGAAALSRFRPKRFTVWARMFLTSRRLRKSLPPSKDRMIIRWSRTSEISNKSNLLTSEITESRKNLSRHFFPRRWLWFCRKRNEFLWLQPPILETIGVRMPQNKLALEFLRACETPLVAPSANLSGKPRADDVASGFWRFERENWLYSARRDDAKSVWNQRSLTALRIFRWFCERARSRWKICKKSFPKREFIKFKENEIAEKSGLETPALFAAGESEFWVSRFNFQDSKFKAAFIGLDEPDGKFDLIKICASVEEYAHEVFDFFRECDRAKMKLFTVRRLPKRNRFGVDGQIKTRGGKLETYFEFLPSTSRRIAVDRRKFRDFDQTAFGQTVS